MYVSKLLFSTLRETPKEAELISHKLMLRANFITKLAAGIYTWMPLGLRTLKKLENMIRIELNKLGAQELLMPVLQPATLWQESQRWEKYGELLCKLHDRHQREFCLGPTHEEVVTDLIRNTITSYKQLPLCIYQIQTKFRDELRPRSGVLRAREFLMKDAYSFHATPACLDQTYQQMLQAYTNILNNLQLQFKVVIADNGDIGGSTSHEFQVIAASGEDRILYTDTDPYAINAEVGDQQSEIFPDLATVKTARSIEVGHIFKLGINYSKVMGANFVDHNMQKSPIIMGCYGIGVSRLLAAILEQNYDQEGMIWPASIAPYKLVIIPINFFGSNLVREFSIDLYNDLQTNLNLTGEVLLDDREARPGVMFKDHALIGIPHRIVINEELASKGLLEYKARREATPKILTIAEFKQLFVTIDQQI